MLGTSFYYFMSALQQRFFPLPIRSAAALNGELNCPTQTPRISFPISVYSHRGGAFEVVDGSPVVENSLPAFRNAARNLKVDLLELDVQLTKDNKVVVLHDVRMERLFGQAYKGRRVSDYDYLDLPLLSHKPGRMYHAAPSPPQPNDPQHTTLDPTTLRVPLLEEIFKEFPGIPVQIDVKVRSQELVSEVNNLITAYKREQSVLWGSFDHVTNTYCYTINPHIPLFTSASRVFYLWSSYLAGRFHEEEVYESAIIIPWRLPLVAKFGWNVDFLSRDWFAGLNEKGLAVVVFGDVNSFDRFEMCREAGANAICTDLPSLLQEYLSNPERKLIQLPTA